MTLDAMRVAASRIGGDARRNATSWPHHRADHKSVEAIGQQVAKLPERQRTELPAWIGRGQYPRRFRSATCAS
jgi:hypothetical protein